MFTFAYFSVQYSSSEGRWLSENCSITSSVFAQRYKIPKNKRRWFWKSTRQIKIVVFFNLFYQINFISSPFSLHELQIITNQFQGIWTVKSFIFWRRAIPIALDERVTIYYKLVFWPNRWQSCALLAISWQLLKDPLNLSANFELFLVAMFD